MPLPLFEAACVAVVVLTLGVMARRRPARDLLADYGALAVAGYLGEESCVALYRFYAYAHGWHGRLDLVPVLVPLIWPLVILSARDVVDALLPGAARARPLWVGLVVAFDASLVEVVAVRAGLWSWAEPGHLAVPLIGILGWGFFAAGADLVLTHGGRFRHAVLVVVAPLFAHALIVASWWALFRWTLRGDLGAASVVAVAAGGAVLAAVAALARRSGRALPLAVAAPRMIAASLFFALLATTAPGEAALWVHTAAVAAPYLIVTAFTGRGSPADRPGATAPSPRGTGRAAPSRGG